MYVAWFEAFLNFVGVFLHVVLFLLTFLLVMRDVYPYQFVAGQFWIFSLLGFFLNFSNVDFGFLDFVLKFAAIFCQSVQINYELYLLILFGWCVR